MTSDEAQPALPTVAFYGDSIVTGHRSVTAPRNRWSSLVSDQLGWREVNLAIDGMGFYRRRGPRGDDGKPTPSSTDTTLLDAVIRLAPDAVLVCLSANDLHYIEDEPELVRRCTFRDFQRLHDELPDVPVVAVTYFRGTHLGPRGHAIIDNVADACAHTGATYVDAFRHVVDGNPLLLAADGVHPNDAGHRALAECILPTLRALNVGSAAR